MISHLLIVDDTLIFCKTNPNETTLVEMCCSLIWSYSRFENDLGKYELMHIGDMLGFEDIANILGCKVSNYPWYVWVFHKVLLSNEEKFGKMD